MVIWIKIRNILAFPHDWQRPAKTEEWVYEQCRDRLPVSVFSQLVCFPWATLIDLQRTGRQHKARKYLDALSLAPPKTTLIRATVCQHIYAMDMLDWFHKLKITDLYWAHAVNDVHEVEGIRIHPFPLYPVRCFDEHRIYSNSMQQTTERGYLYSFIGAYNAKLYLSPVRQWIFELPERADAYVAGRNEWHYEKQVYTQQIAGLEIKSQERQQHDIDSREYAEILQNSVFSLCPSGSGPNSIRLWESLGFGCIPVILADSLHLPGCTEQWATACLRVSEEEAEVRRLPALLEEISNDRERLQEMQSAGRALWEKYGQNGPLTILRDLADTRFIARLVRQDQV